MRKVIVSFGLNMRLNAKYLKEKQGKGKSFF